MSGFPSKRNPAYVNLVDDNGSQLGTAANPLYTSESGTSTGSTKITDGTDTLSVNTDGSINVQTSGSTLKAANIQNVTTAGTKVQLPNVPCSELTIIAKRTNTGYIYAGKNNVSSTVYGVELAAKDSFTFKVSNANEIWIDASVSGEGVSYVAI